MSVTTGKMNLSLSPDHCIYCRRWKRLNSFLYPEECCGCFEPVISSEPSRLDANRNYCIDMNSRMKSSAKKTLFDTSDLVVLKIMPYISIKDAISLTTTYTGLLKLYPTVWKLFHKIEFPKSLLPSNDFVYLRQQMIIAKWYDVLYKSKRHMNIVKKHDNERRNAHSQNKKTLYFKFSKYEQKILDNWRYYCSLDNLGKKYLCWKGNPDSRLFGIRSVYDLDNWNCGKKLRYYQVTCIFAYQYEIDEKKLS